MAGITGAVRYHHVTANATKAGAEKMDLGGYTGIPDTLPEAQQKIVELLDQQKIERNLAQEKLRDLNRALEMIENARIAFNAIEVPRNKL